MGEEGRKERSDRRGGGKENRNMTQGLQEYRATVATRFRVLCLFPGLP